VTVAVSVSPVTAGSVRVVAFPMVSVAAALDERVLLAAGARLARTV